MAQNAFEDNQEEDWIQKVVELEKEKETLIARMEKQDRDAADCDRTLTDALNREAKGSGVEKWEKHRRKL